MSGKRATVLSGARRLPRLLTEGAAPGTAAMRSGESRPGKQQPGANLSAGTGNEPEGTARGSGEPHTFPAQQRRITLGRDR